jgi:hypothetical protein
MMGIFGQYRDRRPRGEMAHRYRCRLDLWLKEMMGIQAFRSRMGHRTRIRTSNGFIEPCA